MSFCQNLKKSFIQLCTSFETRARSDILKILHLTTRCILTGSKVNKNNI